MPRRAANGLGTVVKRADGRYQAAVYVLTTTGDRKRRFVYGKTWDEVNDKRVEMLDNNRKGVPSISSNMKLGDYLDYWLEEIIKVDRGPSTYSGYEIVVRRYIKKHLGTKRLNALTPAHVRGLVAKLRKEQTVLGKPLSDRYVQNVFETLRSALSNAVREELIGRNVARLVETPSRGEFEVEPLSEAQAKAFVKTASAHWLYALWLILITTGLRKGEVLGLAWSDIDMETGAFRVRRTVQRARPAGVREDEDEEVHPFALPRPGVYRRPGPAPGGVSQAAQLHAEPRAGSAGRPDLRDEFGACGRAEERQHDAPPAVASRRARPDAGT